MLSYPVILSVSAVGLSLLAVIVYLVSGSGIAAVLVVGLAAVLVFVLQSFGIFQLKTNKQGIEIDFHERAPSGHDGKDQKKKHVNIKEVFHISDNKYDFNEAPAVCAAYGAELATHDQITEAFALGAEWCSYGWSAGAVALYPTQQATWDALQMNPSESKRTACGLPGVNGGYFDPRLKFGVNCYGTKPGNKGTPLPTPLPGTDSKQFEKMVDKFKKMINSIKLSPFNRDIWSESSVAQNAVEGTEKNIKSAWQTLEKDVDALI
jgi:hypothetical protein